MLVNVFFLGIQSCEKMEDDPITTDDPIDEIVWKVDEHIAVIARRMKSIRLEYEELKRELDSSKMYRMRLISTQNHRLHMNLPSPQMSEDEIATVPSA